MDNSRQMMVVSPCKGATLIMTSKEKQKDDDLYENSYKLEPDGKFQSDKINSVIQEILENELANKTYKPEICVGQSKLLAEKLKQAVKAQGFKKYKLVVMISIEKMKSVRQCLSQVNAYGTQVWTTIQNIRIVITHFMLLEGCLQFL